jgi:hypothetical protein
MSLFNITYLFVLICKLSFDVIELPDNYRRCPDEKCLRLASILIWAFIFNVL